MKNKVKLSAFSSIVVLFISLGILLYGVTILKANPAICVIIVGVTAIYLAMILAVAVQ